MKMHEQYSLEPLTPTAPRAFQIQLLPQL